MKTYVNLPIDKCIPEVLPLLQRHYEESCNFKHLTPMADPDWERYRSIEAQGNLVTVLAADDSLPGLPIIGYAACFIANHPHYGGLGIAWNDVIYVLPEYRKTMAGGRLMKAAAEACKAKGARVLHWHAKPDTPLDYLLRARKLSPLFERVYAQDL